MHTTHWCWCWFFLSTSTHTRATTVVKAKICRQSGAGFAPLARFLHITNWLALTLIAQQQKQHFYQNCRPSQSCQLLIATEWQPAKKSLTVKQVMKVRLSPNELSLSNGHFVKCLLFHSSFLVYFLLRYYCKVLFFSVKRLVGKGGQTKVRRRKRYPIATVSLSLYSVLTIRFFIAPVLVGKQQQKFYLWEAFPSNPLLLGLYYPVLGKDTSSKGQPLVSKWQQNMSIKCLLCLHYTTNLPPQEDRILVSTNSRRLILMRLASVRKWGRALLRWKLLLLLLHLVMSLEG